MKKERQRKLAAKQRRLASIAKLSDQEPRPVDVKLNSNYFDLGAIPIQDQKTEKVMEPEINKKKKAKKIEIEIERKKPGRPTKKSTEMNLKETNGAENKNRTKKHKIKGKEKKK